jgi:thiol-disulfide isomerase/thioredoxin
MTLVAGIAVLGALAGCTSEDGVTGVANDPDTGYVPVGQSSSWYQPTERATGVDFTATSTEGERIDTDDLRGRVVVLNFWYATCPPCRSEAPMLTAAAAGYDESRVVFLGVNVRDTDAASVRAFEKRFEVGYPSVLDADTGEVQLAVASTVPANATPSTLVLDRKGRVAARVLGPLESAAQLGGFIDAALEEG